MTTQGFRPRERVRELYLKRDGNDEAFWWDEGAHRMTGYIIKGPDFYLMGRAVNRFDDWEKIGNPLFSWPVNQQNAWYIWAFAGPLVRIWENKPYYLPYSGWCRRGGPQRWYDSQRMADLFLRGESRTSAFVRPL